jgi:hypothetical protein
MQKLLLRTINDINLKIKLNIPNMKLLTKSTVMKKSQYNAGKFTLATLMQTIDLKI